MGSEIDRKELIHSVNKCDVLIAETVSAVPVTLSDANTLDIFTAVSEQ